MFEFPSGCARHCERSEAIQTAASEDWIVSSQPLLAMTKRTVGTPPDALRPPALSTLQERGLFVCHRIARCHLTAPDHLGIDAALAMTEAALQRGRDIEVARGGVGVDVDGGAAADALDDPEAGTADRERLAEQIELAPGRPAAHIEIGAETQRMHRPPDDSFDLLQRPEIDDRDHLLGDVGKAVARTGQDFRRPL